MKSYLPILLIALSVGLYFLYISPALSEVKSLSAKKAEYENVLSRAQELNDKRDEVLTQYNSIPQEDLDKLGKIIPTKYESTAFANYLNTIAGKYGIAIKNMKDTLTNPTDRSQVAVPTDTSMPFRKNIVTIAASGTYEGFMKFLADLETSLELIDVKKLSLRFVNNDKSSIQTYDFVLEVTVYSLN